MKERDEQLKALKEALTRAQSNLDEARIEIYVLKRQNAALRASLVEVRPEQTETIDLGLERGDSSAR